MKNSYQIGECLTPLDGRNKNKLVALVPYFSEIALNKTRVFVEIEYFKLLSRLKIIRRLSSKEITFLDDLWQTFSEKTYEEIREIEKIVNHDVKAEETYIQEKLKKTSLKDVYQMVHFGLTSDDINNVAYALLIRDCLKDVIIPEIEKVHKKLNEVSTEFCSAEMLGLTHGQAAIPTTFGKEIFVFARRLEEELENLKKLKIKAKFNGNVGNLNAHKFIFPKINWVVETDKFIDSLGLKYDNVTTQIEPYDSLIRIFQNILRINNISLGFCKDIWLYAALGTLKQKAVKSEVGSTALPHKVNPIYFEGSEGGFEIANAMLEMYARKLSYSRLQRDLSDSTVKRSFGIAFSYSLLSYQSVLEGLKRIEFNKNYAANELNKHYEVLSEAVQNFLRVKNYRDAYETAKKFFRGKISDHTDYQKFIKSLRLEKEDEKKLLNLKPENYIGYAKEIIIQKTLKTR